SNFTLAGRPAGVQLREPGLPRSRNPTCSDEEMDMRAAYDFSPLYGSLIGADHMAGLIQNALNRAGGRDYPPYDIEKIDEHQYRITLATAGFRSDELQITVQANLLIVSG